MPKRKSAAEALQQAKERGSEENTEIINGELVHKNLQPQVEKSYQRELDLWLE
jgi:hypothetical protein